MLGQAVRDPKRVKQRNKFYGSLFDSFMKYQTVVAQKEASCFASSKLRLGASFYTAREYKRDAIR